MLAVTIVALHFARHQGVEHRGRTRRTSGRSRSRVSRARHGEPDCRAVRRPHQQPADRHQPFAGACRWRNADERRHVCACALGMVGVANFDLPGLIPIPIVAGLVFFLGYTFIIDALWRPYAQRAWLDLLLAVGIMVVCIQYGYLIGVLVGLVCACMLFAISYARLGVVRRHMTRAHVRKLCRPVAGGVRAFARDRRRHPNLLALRLHLLRLVRGRVRAHPQRHRGARTGPGCTT